MDHTYPPAPGTSAIAQPSPTAQNLSAAASSPSPPTPTRSTSTAALRILDPGQRSHYCLSKPGGGHSDTLVTVSFTCCKYAVVKCGSAVPGKATGPSAIDPVASPPAEGYCLLKFVIRIRDDGVDPRFRVTRVQIEVHFPNPSDAWNHLAVPNGKKYVAMRLKRPLEEFSFSASAELFAGLVTAGIGYEEVQMYRRFRGIVITSSQSDKSVIWHVDNFMNNGTFPHIPLDIIVGHQPRVGFDARLVIKVTTRLRKGCLRWQTLRSEQQDKIRTDGSTDTGDLDDIMLLSTRY